MPANATRPQQSNALAVIGGLLILTGTLMTGGSLGPFVGLIVALLGIAMMTAWLVRRR